MIFADDADTIDTLRRTWEAADAAHTAACRNMDAARRALVRSRSKVRMAAYDAADAALETAASDLVAADRAHVLAIRAAERRIAQAIRAARAVANGVQLSLEF